MFFVCVGVCVPGVHASACVRVHGVMGYILSPTQYYTTD